MVKIDGELKTISIGRKPEKEGTAKLVARVILEFEPTEKGIAELQDLIAMQDQFVNVVISTRQIELPLPKAAKG
jgi:hypothetical protein